MIAEFDPKTVAFLKELIGKKKELAPATQAIRGLATPESFPKAFETMQKLVATFSNAEFLSSVQSAAPIAQMAADQIMHTVVALYDSAIKTMKGSTQFDKDTKARHFDEMLKPYYKLFTSWLHEMNFYESYHHRFLNAMEGVLFRDPTTEDLKPSPSFNAAAAILIRKIFLLEIKPLTKEDLFTMIHQNLLMILSQKLSNLVSGAMLKQMTLPPLVKSTVARLQELSASLVKKMGVRGFRTGMEISSNSFSVEYHFPLRAHSMILKLIYEEETGLLSMHVEFSGAGRMRNECMDAYATVVSRERGFVMSKKPTSSPDMLEFAWTVKDDEQIKQMIDEIVRMIGYTFNISPELFLKLFPKLTQKELIDKFLADPNPKVKFAAIEIAKGAWKELSSDFWERAARNPDGKVRLSVLKFVLENIFRPLRLIDDDRRDHLIVSLLLDSDSTIQQTAREGFIHLILSEPPEGRLNMLISVYGSEALQKKSVTKMLLDFTSGLLQRVPFNY